MAKGGARPGAGRKPGSTTVPQFRSYVSEEERKTFVEFVLSTYMADMRLTTWLGDQLFGKAPQPLSDPDGSPLFSSLKELSDGELERLAAGGAGGASQAGTRTA